MEHVEGDNLSKQADEVEAMASIYPDDWVVEDEARRIYSITVRNGEAGPEVYLNLQVTFPPEYPSAAPPQYQLSAPWLRGQHRRELSNELEEIYIENMGESIIFMWVDKMQDFMQAMFESGEISPDRPSGSQRSDTSLSVASPNSSKSEMNTTVSSACSDDVNARELEDWGDGPCHPTPDLASGYTADAVHATEPEEQEAIECPQIFHGESFVDRKSTFQGHIAAILHKEQVQMVLDSLCENKKIASATHNIYAYRILRSAPNNFLTGCEDDGEHAAGGRLLHLLEIVNAQNVIVVVTRWYGGIHLGPDRFKHINNCARAMLVEHNYVSNREEKKKLHSKKKRK